MTGRKLMTVIVWYLNNESYTTIKCFAFVAKTRLVSKDLVSIHTIYVLNIVWVASTSSPAVMSPLQTGDSLIRLATLESRRLYPAHPITTSFIFSGDLIFPSSFWIVFMTSFLFFKIILNHNFHPVVKSLPVLSWIFFIFFNDKYFTDADVQL